MQLAADIQQQQERARTQQQQLKATFVFASLALKAQQQRCALSAPIATKYYAANLLDESFVQTPQLLLLVAEHSKASWTCFPSLSSLGNTAMQTALCTRQCGTSCF